MNKLPQEIICNQILPYTHRVKDKKLLLDIQSFIRDYNILEHVYYCEYASITLLYDLQMFVFNSNKYIFSRFNQMKNKNKIQVCHFEINFFKNNIHNTERKIKMIWGILTPTERTQFINKFIIDKFDI